jgi:hypothetical protein
MRKLQVTLIMVVMISLQGIAGCSLFSEYDTYACVRRGTCNLPASPEPGKGLVYLIRPSRFFNPSEKQQVYVTEDGGHEHYISYITDSRYCVIQVLPGNTEIRVTGQINEDILDLFVQENGIYYVILDTSAGIFSAKLGIDLRLASEKEGEKYLVNDVVEPCGQ